MVLELAGKVGQNYSAWTVDIYDSKQREVVRYRIVGLCKAL